jgi:glycerophosphoryl diester phosphodiesterase
MTVILNTPGTFRAVLGHLRRNAWPLIIVSAFYRIIAVTLLTPMVGGLISVLIAGSGRGTIVNEEIAAFFLEPLGLITLVAMAAVGLTLIALEQACLMSIAFDADRSGFNQAFDALKFVFSRSPGILALAARIILRVLLLGIPFLIPAALVYSLMLTNHDINYYLTQWPPVFKWAIATVAIIGLGFSITFTRFAASVVLSLPILLFEAQASDKSLRESRLRARGYHRRFATGIFIWTAAVVVAASITATAFVWLGRLVAPALVLHTPLLLLVFGGLFLAFSLTQLILSMAATASFSFMVVQWYGTRKPTAPDSVIKLSVSNNSNHKPIYRISGRAIIAGTLLAFVLAMLTGWQMFSNADLEDRTEIMAHRGASAAAPENTMAAIEKAIADGAHWVEIDVQRTNDDQVVVVHDRDLMKIGGEPLVVSESLLGDIVKLDVGSWFDPAFSSQRIPTLDQVLKHCKEAIKVNIELKYYKWDERLALRVIEIVEKSRMEDDIVVMSLKPEAVRQVKIARPGWRVGLLSAAALTDLIGEEADFLAVHSKLATPGFVRRAHDADKALYVWTVNDAVSMMQMFARGVDALITDEPALAAHLLEQRKKLEPAERMLMAAGLLTLGESEHIDPAGDE